MNLPTPTPARTSSPATASSGPVARLPLGAAQDRGDNFSDAAGLSEDLLIIARIERLMLLTDAYKARKRHASTKGIMRRLRGVTARLAAMGG